LRTSSRFHEAVARVQQLRDVDHYQAAFIFGSVARGEEEESSDLDVQVLVDRVDCCGAINHPIVGGVKLDLSFLTLRQLDARTQSEVEKGARVPIVAESIVVFDKTGELTRLRDAARQVHPTRCSPARCREIQFAVYHAHDKASRLLVSDPGAALLVMHTSLVELLNAHYRIHTRWQVSDKRLLKDLRAWDPHLARAIERLVVAADVRGKFALWTDIIDHVMKPLGGPKPIGENNCDCGVCRRDLAHIDRSGS
jgi:predicted nucleotidyltransferase